MKKYKVITVETIQKISNCFTDTDEVIDFVKSMDILAEEIVFAKQYMQRTSGDLSAAQLAIQIIAFTDFCRERMDMLNQLVRSLDFQEMTEEEILKMERDHG